MKPPLPPRHNRPLRDDAKWEKGKSVFGLLGAGVDVTNLTDDEVKTACYYLSTVSTLPTGGGAVKRALRAEAKKRGIVP